MPASGNVRRPSPLLTQNSEMRQIGAWNWSLPAWAGRLPDGRTFNTCPSAGICAQACYARHGTYTWPVVRAKHQANLMFVLDDLPGWEAAMLAELEAARFCGAWIRIHDAGDFFSDAYLQAWLRICRARPDIHFYAYTKEVARFRLLVEPEPPPNFLGVYSYGGTQDADLSPESDRVADVFPDEAAIAAAGWTSQEANDLLAVLGPHLVGVPANRIPRYLKRMAGRRFSEWQAESDSESAARKNRRHLRLIVDDSNSVDETNLPNRASAKQFEHRRAA
ncbi:GP88 family protein [Amycolatopsis nivea]